MEIPSHIAIIMDGNGRWANEKGMPRRKGHYQGVKSLKSVVEKAGELGVKCLTVYAFSTENWKRPDAEVDFLMRLFSETLKKQTKKLLDNNVKVRIIGRRKGLSRTILKSIEDIEKSTSSNQGLLLNIAFNYGGRTEILDMMDKFIKKNNCDLNNLKDTDLNKFLYSPYYPDVDLLIRTGGDKRLSNFMLWQCAYAELYFVDKCWPDFNGSDLEQAIHVFNLRERRYGGLTEAGEN